MDPSFISELETKLSCNVFNPLYFARTDATGSFVKLVDNFDISFITCCATEIFWAGE